RAARARGPSRWPCRRCCCRPSGSGCSRTRWAPLLASIVRARHGTAVPPRSPIMSHGRPAAGDGSAGPLRTAPLEARMRILHPTDFSRTAEKALTVARDLKERLGGTLHVVHVQTRFEETLGLVRLRPHLDSVNPELERRLEEARQEEVRRLNDMLRSLASPDGTYELRWGEPLQELLEMQGDFDLVVMGAHGSNRIDRYFLGGVAGRFVRRTRVPVITVREECQVTSGRRALVATDFSEAAHGAGEAAQG